MSVPKLRFKADDGSEFPEWEESSFSDIFTKLNNNTLSRDCLNEHEGYFQNIHYGDVLIKYGSVVDMATDYVPFINDEIDCSKCTLLHDGDVVVSDTAEDETVGKTIEIQNLDNKKVVSGLHTMAWRPREKFAPKYLGYYMNSSVYHDQLRPYMQGIKVTSISKANIVLTTISYPSIAEQRKISGFFSIIDRVIEQTQSEIDAWEKQKRGVMQLLFSQKVRFKADDGSEFPEWEEKKLGDVAYIVMGQSPDSSSYNENGDGKPLVQGNADIQDKRTVPTRWTNEPTKIAEINDILISVRAPVGTVGIATMPVCCGRGVCAIRAKGNISQDYLYQYLISIEEKWSKEAQGGTFKAISGNDIKERKANFPDILEQQKIATCLSGFDDVIDKAKRELLAYRELKKGLLQQMFV